MSLGSNLLRGSGLNLIDLFVKTGAVFVLTPVLLTTLGTDGYGTWLLGMSIIGYLMLADMGMSFSVTRLVAGSLGTKNAQRSAMIIESAVDFYRLVGWSVLGLSIFSSIILTILGWKNEIYSTLCWVVLICGCSTGLRLIVRTSMILLRAHVRYDLLAWASISRTIFQTPAMYFALNHGAGILGIAICYGIGDCLEFILQYRLAQSLPQVAKTNTIPSDRQEIRAELFKHSRLIIFGIVGENLRVSVNPFVINHLFGLNFVSIYSVGLRLITLLEDVVNSLFGGQLLAAFSQIHGGSDQSKLIDSFLKISIITSSFSFCAMTGALWIAPMFLHRWLGPAMQQSYQVMLILSLPFALRFTQYPAHNLLYALGKTHWLVVMTVVGGSLSLIAGTSAGIYWGLNGLIYGMAIVMTIERLFVIPLYIYRSTGLSAWKYLANYTAWPALKCLILPYMYIYVVSSWLSPEYIRIAILTAGFVIVFLISFYFVVLDSGARQSLLIQITGRRFKK